MKTIKQLSRGEGKFWTYKPSNELSSLEILAWDAAADLAALVEMTYEPGEFWVVAPETYTVLMGLDEYFKEINVLPSQSLAILMLTVDRVNFGLTARGDDTKKPTMQN